MCRAPSIPPPPPPVVLEQAPQMANMVADQSLQAGPKTPKDVPAGDPTLARRGKRGLVIPLRTNGA